MGIALRKSRFSEEQIVAIIQEYAAGAKVSELCRKHGMSYATFYTWKAKYGGLQVSDVRRLKDLETENGKLKKLLALRRRKRKKIPKGSREGAWCPIVINQRSSLDFTMDALANGRKFHTANLKDDCTRECPAIDVALSIPGSRVVEMRERGYGCQLWEDCNAALIPTMRVAMGRERQRVASQKPIGQGTGQMSAKSS